LPCHQKTITRDEEPNRIRIINDYLEYCKAREKEAREEIVTLEARTLLEIEFVFNLN